MKVFEIEDIFKEVFKEEEGLVKTVDSVYEKSDDGKFFKLVISIHDLRIQDTLVIHTKFIFKTDLDKNNLIENSFLYLYDINCIYREINFETPLNLEESIKDIIDSNKFGKDIQLLSEFIATPGVLLSHYLRHNKITNYSVYNANYDPKFKTAPCNEVTFDFNIDMQANGSDYEFSVIISKEKDVNKNTFYRFIFKLLDKVETIDVDDLTKLHYTIGSKIVDMLNDILK